MLVLLVVFELPIDGISSSAGPRDSELELEPQYMDDRFDRSLPDVKAISVREGRVEPA